MTPFSRDPAGVSMSFTTGESALIAALAQQLITLLEDRAAQSPADVLFAQLGIGGPTSAPLDPALARLLPDAYRDDGEASSEHRHLTELGLVQRKITNARAVIDSLGGEPLLDDAAVQAWLRHLTDLRLTVAARLQIEHDGDVGLGDEGMLDLYDWLGHLQGTLVECLE